MRIILVTFCSLIACLIIFWTVKFWGRSQHYVPYSHPIYVAAAQSSAPLIFIKPKFENFESAINSNQNLYLNVATTSDQILVIPKREFKEKAIRNSKMSEIASDVVLFSTVKEKLENRFLVLNLLENAHAGHAIFWDELKKMGWDKGERLIITSPYEAIAKSLKELAPALLYGSTQPEILRIVAMDSMNLIEAVSLRADVIIHPLKIRNQDFYQETILKELKRRHKQILVGPVTEEQLSVALDLQPLGIIVEK
ncbi:MAG: hypothetical protein A2622_06270 [Bdellovibrionales bacterium RIFCSPHIGHO2_01_FULL_40_29]|nr:MAG: hypothetical protein A2622_06270 [Bdellovibrionales bacterium RIFCSPHIGHO2_01_FULL_40_29]OFZ35052.1 MAG: hypothetical protein A3D17_06620 [Bdellovibrionales bacterium RIFCSPHIGHO2_02_FULL_40_15]